MFCPVCQTVLEDDAERCPGCDKVLRSAQAENSVALVEATAVSVAAAPDAEREPGTAIVVHRAQDRALTPLARAARLPALAWRRPAVRAAVKTGASAVALSLTLRAVRALLATRRAMRPPASSSLVPALADLLRAGEQSAAAGRPDQGQGQQRLVSETIIYIRRSVRV